MKRKFPLHDDSDSESDASFDSDGSDDSEKELQRAFVAGELQPGLNAEVPAPRKFTNNSAALKEKLSNITLKLDWIERLDLTTNLDPIVDGILTGKEAIEPKYKVITPGDRITDDLQRETLFYRQAQSAIIEGLSRLKALGIPTKRPDDYFAQMAKSDDHMLKVKRKILEQQIGQEKAQKVKKLRELKKYGKKVQVEVGLQRAKEKRELLAKVKQYREGKLGSLDFLEEKDGKKKNMLEVTKQKTKERNESKRVFQPMNKGKIKRQSKDNKFGFGGKKSGAKKNNMKKEGGQKTKKLTGAGASRGGGSNRGGMKSRGGGRGGRGGGRGGGAGRGGRKR